MKKLFLIVLLIMFAFVAAAAAAQLTVAWDANNPAPSGYALFERNFPSGGLYSYDNPIWPIDGKDHTETTATVEISDTVEHAFVLRAYVKKITIDGSVITDWSGDSNEIMFMPKTTVENPKNLIMEAVQYLSQAIESLAKAVKAIN